MAKENEVRIAFKRKFFVYTYSLVGVAAGDRVPALRCLSAHSEAARGLWFREVNDTDTGGCEREALENCSDEKRK